MNLYVFYYYNLHCTILYEMSYGYYSSLLSSFKFKLDGVHLLMRYWQPFTWPFLYSRTRRTVGSMQSNVLSRLSASLKVSNVEYLLMLLLSHLLLFKKMYDLCCANQWRMNHCTSFMQLLLTFPYVRLYLKMITKLSRLFCYLESAFVSYFITGLTFVVLSLTVVRFIICYFHGFLALSLCCRIW